MKILVAIKRVLDYAVRARIDQSGRHAEIGNVKMSINPFCEIAVEEAVRLKQKYNTIKEIIAVTAGNNKGQETLRQALAMGADKALLLKTEMRTDDELQPLAVAKLLKESIEKEKPHIVLLGKQAIDDDSNQTGQILAGLLKWSQATFASKVEFVEGKNDVLRVTREIDEGLQTLDAELPCIITCDLRLNQPRYATLPNIMKAKKKPLEVIEATSLGIDLSPRLEILGCFEPPKRRNGQILNSVDELIDVLKNEVKVIV
ncbi:MAG: electron transfer flavoprotein subunit beta/FixA family protein [Alphaproteobacteria bacterium]|nr:electron transfer flavoprotein subunit beta/FixA family protein [Alphaproteobacteria bacterium]